MSGASRYYKFGKFRLDRQNQLLLNCGRRVPLTPKTLELLLYLVENAGKVVSHEEIFNRIWTNVFVTDAVLVQNIAVLRRALSTEGTSENLIETLPKHGYRFAGKVEFGEDFPSLDSRQSVAVLPPVLPVEHSSEHAFMSVSIADALTLRLGRFSTLSVVASASVLNSHLNGRDPYEIGRLLGVNYVLTGRLSPHRDSVDLSFKLLRVNGSEVVWQRSFSFTAENFLFLKEKIANRINQLITNSPAGHATAPPPQPTGSKEAYLMYLKGRYFWNRRGSADLFRAIDYFEKSVELDETFGLAYAGLCDSYTMLINYDLICPCQVIEKARGAASRALEFNPELSESHASMGYIHAAYDWNWNACEEEFLTAVELNPNNITVRHWLASLYAVTRRYDESISVIGEARETDPLSPILGAMFGWNLYLMNRFQEAEEELRKVLELAPNFPPARLYLGRVYVMQERFAEAVEEFQIADDFFKNASTRAEIAYSKISGGKRSDGLKILDELLELKKEKYVSPYALAFVYEALGEREHSVRMLQKAYREHSISMQWFGIEPRFAEIRQTAFGKELLRRTNHRAA